MQNFQNHPSQSTNPTEAMSHTNLLDDLPDSDLSAFEEFMRYDSLGQSMTFDEMLFSVLKLYEFKQPVTIDDLLGLDFLGLLRKKERHRLAVDTIFFSQRFPGTLRLVSIDPIGRPEFVVPKRR